MKSKTKAQGTSSRPSISDTANWLPAFAGAERRALLEVKRSILRKLELRLARKHLTTL